MRTPVLLTLLAAAGLTAVPRAQPDRLAAEIARWSSLVAADTRTDPLWLDAKKNAGPVLAQAEDALKQGRRLVALERLSAAAHSLGAARYVVDRPAGAATNLPAFEAEWKRAGAELRDVLAPGGPATADISPALARALAELAVSQARESYAASLEYGRNTEPQFGFYYLGAARAQRNFLDLARELPAAPAARPPALRALRAEIDGLQSELLAAYRPPAAIDRHPEFIVASSALKEARELDAAGQRFAALLRYLQAAQRLAMLREPSAADTAAVTRGLEEAALRLTAGTDHSIGRFFVERAQTALATGGPPGADAAARAIARDVLPRYFAALEPARPVAAAPAARVTVTLVRWPFT